MPIATMVEKLSLKGKLDLAAVGELHTDLLACEGKDVIVSLGDVTHLGALCLQTMIAAATSARNAGHTFQVVDTSDRVLGQLSAMGMSPETITEGRI